MKREMINGQEVEQIVGGTILFSTDHTTCGKNDCNQYRVLDYDAAIKYIQENCYNMTEKTMLRNMADAGILANL